MQNASAASAHAFVASAETAESEPEAESEPPVPPSDETLPPSEPNAPELLDEEQAAMETMADAKIRTARFTKTSSRWVRCPGRFRTRQKTSLGCSSTEKNELLDPTAAGHWRVRLDEIHGVEAVLQ